MIVLVRERILSRVDSIEAVCMGNVHTRKFNGLAHIDTWGDFNIYRTWPVFLDPKFS